MKRLVALVVVAVAAFAGTAAAATRDVVQSVSSNWAGYAVADPATISGTTPEQPLTFTSVTATWVQPKATCAAGSTGYAAFWVGLGGYSESSQALEQTGTESDCNGSTKPSYFAWYELVPAPSTRVSLKVLPGDTITASVNVNGTDVLVQLKDRTRRTSFTKHLQLASPDLTSAEWIAEAPSECDQADSCRTLPLANFGTVSFSRIATIADGHGGTLTDTAWAPAEIQLVPGTHVHRSPLFDLPDQSSTAGATPGTASPDGRTFSVAWTSQATAG